ncbi:tetratricopeptide repeat protein [Clostridium tetani]|nr:tetratricopeptide repeat protein [Clostridium tetani]
MKIKVKLKTLISLLLLSLFIILIVVPYINLGIGEYLNKKGSPKAQAFYKNYLSSPIKLNEKKALYLYGESILGGFHKYTIMFMYSGFGEEENNTLEDIKKAKEAFEKILLKDSDKNYNNKYTKKAYSRLMDISIATLNIDELLHWISWGKDKNNEEIKNISKLYEGYYYYTQRDYKKAETILHGYNKGMDLDFKYYYLLGDIYSHRGNIEKAMDYFEKASSIGWISGEYLFGGSNISHKNTWFKDYKKKLKGDYKIRGKVSYNGKGLPFVEVYMNDEIGVFYTGGNFPVAITDKNGEFETLGFTQGVYDVGIGINTSQLYDKVFLRQNINSIQLNKDIDFNFKLANPIRIKNPLPGTTIEEKFEVSWDEVKGVDYYTVEVITFGNPKEKSGSSFRYLLHHENGEYKIEGNNIKFNIKKLNENIGVGGLSFDEEEMLVNPSGILGTFTPNIEYPIVVNGYDKEGKLIAKSLPSICNYDEISSIKVEGDLTLGEQLILDEKYEKAIKYYEEKLNKNPKDKEALLYLSKFYMIGWKKDKKDYDKALKYAKEYDDLTNNKLSFEVVDFMKNQNIRENKKLVKEILDNIPQKHRDTNYYHQRAKYHLALEEFEKARESYEKMTDYKFINMIYIDMYLGDYKKAIDVLTSGEINLRKMNVAKVIDAFNNMDNISKKDKELFNELLKSVLVDNLSIEDGKKLYEKVFNSVDNMKVKQILEEMKKEEYWDQM